jgi:uncharacterized protein
MIRFEWEVALGKFVVACFIALSLTGSVYSQQSSEPERPTKEQIQQFLDLMQTKQMMNQLVEGIKAAQKKGAEETFKRLIPSATQQQLDRVNSITDDAFKDFPVDEMADAIIPIYQRHFTRADLDAIIAFYKSPTGLKLLKERPAMMAEGMQAGQDVMLKRLPGIVDRLKNQIAKLADEESKTDKQVK